MKFVVLATLLSLPGALGKNTSSLRGSSSSEYPHRALNPVFCGCEGCDAAAFDVYAGDYKCGDRINYLQTALGFSEERACARVAGEEFPGECGVCDPSTCSPPQAPPRQPRTIPTGRCGCPGCDDEAWNAMAGDYSCGSRISWLQSALSFEERDACLKVANEEFPGDCGRCDPTTCSNNDDNDDNTPSTDSPTTTSPTREPTAQPTVEPTKAPTPSPTNPPTEEPTKNPTAAPTLFPTKTPTDPPVEYNFNNDDDNDFDDVASSPCGCSTCTSVVLDTFAGEYKCGDRISYLQNSLGFDEREACARVAGTEFPSECGGCDPDRCDRPGFNNNNDNNDNNNNNNNPDGQKCGGAVNSSSNAQAVCQQDLWSPTGDSSMYCFAYGGSGDPCHLNNNNDPSDGRFKDPSACTNSDTFYLWDEPDTQGRSYDWAGRTWLEYSQRFPQQLRDLRSRGVKVTSPMLKAGGPGVLENNLAQFYNACGPACSDPNDPAYIDVIAVNAFCGPFNGPAGCRGGAGFIYQESLKSSRANGDIPVYITNWSKLQTSNPQDQVDAIEAIEEFFPASAASNPVVERVYWFGATDFGGGSSNNFLTQVLNDGSTLGERWKAKCDSL